MLRILGDLEDQIEPDPYGRVLIHGQPGSGKSTLAESIAELGKTLFIYIKGEEGIGSVKNGPNRDNIIFHRLGRNKPDDPIGELWEILWDLESGEHDLTALVIDGLTALQTLWYKTLLNLPLDSREKVRPATDYDFWGELRDEFKDFFTFFYALAAGDHKRPIHVVMTAQTKQLDDAEGSDKMQPDLFKGPLASAVVVPDHIMYTHMEGAGTRQKHAVRVQPSATVVAKMHTTYGTSVSIPPVLGLKTRLTLPNYLKTLGAAGV